MNSKRTRSCRSEFAIVVFNVTNGEFLDFVRAGGYRERSFWDPRRLELDRFGSDSSSQVLGPARRDLVLSHDVRRHSTAIRVACLRQPGRGSAYARWKGKDLPTEAQYHRAAFGSPEGLERAFPWGEQLPGPQHRQFRLPVVDASAGRKFSPRQKCFRYL